ncbi:VOC family protein [Loktanella sp. D2R18]|uniref:VOC family protein n=1 Tax=Rhodobacterales TaxID=204455 RepID=UPI000DEBFF71|nr:MULTISPECIES: VOC family protein [Rhodobacterales]MDO6592059.1 VOC family protein [Yoonia sp. 1_MG-2023]RBW44810.1 VOC family protein [Loktanella sp. D2R18]
MVNVLGVGGVFFRAKDPVGLADWYQTYLGIAPAPTTSEMAPWVTETGVTVFSPFDAKTEYFPKDKAFMINFRIADLDAACAELLAAGITCGEVVEMDGVGRFVRIHDPEGNPIELWEPTAPA